MKSGKPWRRRDFFKTAVSSGLVVGLAGCSGNQENQGTDTGEQTTANPETPDDSVSINGFEVPKENVVSGDELADEQAIDSLELLVQPPDTTPNNFETAQFVSDTISELGVEVEVNGLNWSSYVEKIWFDKEWDFAVYEWVGRPHRLDPNFFLREMFGSDQLDSINYHQWVDEEFQETVLAQEKEPDQDRRQQLVYKAQEILHNRGPTTVIFNPEQTNAWNADRWTGVTELQGMGVINPITFRNIEPTGDKDVLTLSWDAELRDFNPFNEAGENVLVNVRMLYDRLMLPDEEALPQNQLATRVERVDDTTVEIDIREGHQFHDGVEVTAEDVKYSYNINKEYETDYTGTVSPIESISIDGDYSLTFNLSFPYQPLEIAVLSYVNIVPKHHWEDIIENKMEVDNPYDYREDEPLGSGPLQFDFWEKGDQIRLNRYDDHYDPVSYEARVMRVIPDVTTTLNQLQAGEIDMIGIYRGDKNTLADIVEGDDALDMAAVPTLGYKQLSYHQQSAPFHIPEFRRALHHRVDKDTIVNDIFNGWGTKTTNTTISTALDFWHNGELDEYAFNLQAAANELVDGGFVWDEEGTLYMPEGKTEPPSYESGDGGH